MGFFVFGYFMHKKPLHTLPNACFGLEQKHDENAHFEQISCKHLDCGLKSSDEILQSFLIVIKAGNDDASALGNEMATWLQNRGKKVSITQSMIAAEDLRGLAKPCEIVLILGGDGTILGVARCLYGLCIPILGVNFGQVGFLADISPHDWQDAFELLLHGGYQIQNYSPLFWEHYREGICLERGHAINDVVVARAKVARSIYISLFIDEIFLSDLHCDGLICSAPLGATGYAASAHGPLAFPALDAQILTPISPFAGSFPPLVLPREARVSIVAHDAGETCITVDGQNCHTMEVNDVVHVRGALQKVSMFVRDPNWYWQRLRDRGFIMHGPGKYTCG